MINLKNFMLFNEFGTSVSLLADRTDLPPRAKLALMNIYKHFQQRLLDIEDVRPKVKNENEKLSVEQIDEFDSLLKSDFSFLSDKICIEDVVELLSTKDLMLLDPIIKE